MKRKGFNIIEMIIVVAIIGIVFSLTAPLVKSFGMVNERIRVQNEVDREFAVVSKFIKEEVKSARRTSKSLDVDVKYDAIFDLNGEDFESFSDLTLETELDEDTGTISALSTGSVLFLEIPYEESDDGSDDDSKLVFLFFEDSQLRYIEDFDDSTEEILMENVSDGSFELSTDGVVTFSIDLDVGDYEGKIKDSIRESAVSRIDLDI
jgi:prepilin-type N-terminal cleavage/methylation domain-containing protein